MWRHMEIFSEKSKVGPKAKNTAYSQVVTQPSTDATQLDLTSVIGREPVCFLWCHGSHRPGILLEKLLGP